MDRSEQMDFDGMEDQAKAFDQAAEEMSQAASRLKAIAQKLDDGAMLGKAGDALADALRQRGVPALEKLGGKLSEEARDVRDSVREMQEAVNAAKSKFG
ncbi:MAG TPA: WXG100 family type VII secretion target [Anaerolineales bacterium]|nr:WXG100 family type VII secretion target [Anaerolineales bacterium]